MSAKGKSRTGDGHCNRCEQIYAVLATHIVYVLYNLVNGEHNVLRHLSAMTKKLVHQEAIDAMFQISNPLEGKRVMNFSAHPAGHGVG